MNSFTDQVTKTQTKQRILQKRVLKPKTVQKNVSQNMIDSLIGGGSQMGRPIGPLSITLFGFPDRPKVRRKISPKQKPSKKKPKKYVARITGFEAAIGGGYRLVEAGKKFTGFEAVRGRKVKKIVKKRKLLREKRSLLQMLNNFKRWNWKDKRCYNKKCRYND